MLVTEIKVNNNSVSIFTDNFDSTFALFMGARVSPNAIMLREHFIPLQQKGNNEFVFYVNTIQDYPIWNDVQVWDIVCAPQDFSARETVVKMSDFVLEKFKNFCLTINNNEIETSLYFCSNAQNGLAVRATHKQVGHIVIENIKEANDYYEITVKSDLQSKFQMFLAKRDQMKHEYKYTCMLQIDLLGGNIYRFNKIHLQDVFLENKQIWDIIAVRDNINFVCNSSQISSEYFSINENFEAKWFVSEGVYPSLFIHEKVNMQAYSRIRIGILGSCFTKEAFHSIDYLNPDYKKYYENGFIAFHSSIISLMSKPVSLNSPITSEGQHTKLLQYYAEMELKKTFFQQLANYKPDYLLVDNYADTAACILETSDGAFFTDCFYFANSSIINNISIKRKYFINAPNRFELYKDALLKFRESIIKIISPDKIILIKGRKSEKRRESNGTISDWPDRVYTHNANILWDRNDAEFEKVFPEARVIDMRNSTKYFSWQPSPLAPSPQHLTESYYKDLLVNVHKIVLYDILKKSKI